MEASVHSCHFVPVFPYRPELNHKRPQIPQPPQGFPTLPENWVVEFESFESEDREATLFGHLFRPQQVRSDLAHRAAFVLHGQGEHSGRYIHWPHYLQESLGSIYALDHRGHGQSTGFRGHVSHFDVYAHDAAFALRRYAGYLKGLYGKAEIHVVAHSMGGLIALRMLLLHPDLPVQSVSLSAPMFDLGFKVPKTKQLASRLIHKVLPFVPLPTEKLGDLVSRDPAVCKHYLSDKLNHGFASTGFYYSYLDVKEDTIRRAGEFQQAILLMIPLQDRVIDPASSQGFFKALQGENKQLIVYPDLYHEIFNEPEKDQAFQDLNRWIAHHSH